MPWKLRPPPPPDTLFSNDVTVAMTTYCAPVSLPSLALVDFETRPEAARSCSSRTDPRLCRSTILNFSVPDNSLLSIPARSVPVLPLHQPALVSFRNSATASTGLAAQAEDTHNNNDVARNTILRILFPRACVRQSY